MYFLSIGYSKVMYSNKLIIIIIHDCITPLFSQHLNVLARVYHFRIWYYNVRVSVVCVEIPGTRGAHAHSEIAYPIGQLLNDL